MVAPVVLKKDSEVIESVGCFISRYLFLKEPYVGSVVMLLVLTVLFVKQLRAE